MQMLWCALAVFLTVRTHAAPAVQSERLTTPVAGKQPHILMILAVRNVCFFPVLCFLPLYLLGSMLFTNRTTMAGLMQAGTVITPSATLSCLPPTRCRPQLLTS
jgi:hypothetical protein